MGKHSYVIRRLTTVIPMMLIMSTIVFFFTNAIPGNPASYALGQEGNPEQTDRLFKLMGLDKPVHERYFDWLGKILRGDLGQTTLSNEPIAPLIQRRLIPTMWLSIFTMAVAIPLSIPLGVTAALNRRSKVDVGLSALSFFGVSMPGFWFALILIIVFGLWLHWFPLGGFVDPILNPVEGIRHMTLPAGSLGLILMANLTRMVRSSMLEVVMQDYITTARAKGISERLVIYKHALKNAMIPVTTVIGIQIAVLIGGVVITEQIFLIPGMGRLIYLAVNSRDYTLISSSILILVLLMVIINLVVDLVYAYLDPRVRFD